MNKLHGTFILIVVFTIGNIANAQQYRTGLNIDKESPSGLAIYESDAFGFGDEIPDSTSLREYAPYPGNQGNYGTCVGWAWGYCGLTTLYARQFGIKNRNVITAMAMCPYSVFNNIRSEHDSGCQNGAGLVEAGDFVTQTGSKRFHLRDSECGSTDEIDEGLMIFKADSYSVLWNWPEEGEEDEKNKVEKAKSALADGHIVEIGMGVPQSFSSGVNENGEWIKSDNFFENRPGGGHAMCVIGYNDNRLGGTFEIQNSWGQDWGDGGYVYLSYEDFQEYVIVALVLELEEENKWKDAASKQGCLFGDCDGTYSRFTFKNGDSYEGLTKNGMPNGNGIYIWADDDVYAGDFKDGIKEGVGTYYFADGTSQTGHWKEDVYRADMAYLDYNYGTIDLGNAYWKGYSNGKAWMYGSYYLSYGLKIYEGKFSEGAEPDDFGLLMRYGKNTLSEFNEGEHHGYSAVFEDEVWSVYKCENNDCDDLPEAQISTKIEDFSKSIELQSDSTAMKNDGCKFGDCDNGFSKFTYASGNQYEGFLVNGWRHGYGIYTFTGESEILSFEGEYKFGKRHGLGRLMMKDGGWFIGEFERGKASGKGMWVKADGTVQAGFWEKGNYVESDNGFGFAGGDGVALETETKDEITPVRINEPHKFLAPIKLQ